MDFQKFNRKWHSHQNNMLLLKQRPSLMEKIKEFREVNGIITLFFQNQQKEKVKRDFSMYGVPYICVLKLILARNHQKKAWFLWKWTNMALFSSKKPVLVFKHQGKAQIEKFFY